MHSSTIFIPTIPIKYYIRSSNQPDMKNLLLLVVLFLGTASFAQKVTINPNLVVNDTEFKVTSKTKYSFDDKIFEHSSYVDNIGDYTRNDTLMFYMTSGGLKINGLRLKFYNTKIFVDLYEWSDGGGITTITPFNSYTLALNQNNYKLGDTISGTFIGTVTKAQDSVTTKFELEGKFIHIVENTPVKRKKKLIDEHILHNKMFRETGFYRVSDTAQYVKHKLVNSEKEYYLEVVAISHISSFETIKSKFIKDSVNIVQLKLTTRDQTINYWTEYSKKLNGSYAFVLNNNLLFVSDTILIDSKDVIINIQVRDKAEADKIVEEIKAEIEKKQTYYYKEE